MRSLLVFLALSIAAVFCPRMAVAQSAPLPDLPILAGIELGAGLNIAVNTAINQTNWLKNDGSSLVMEYPGGEFIPAPSSSGAAQPNGPQPNFGFVLIYSGVSTIAPRGARAGQDMRAYQALRFRMRGDQVSTVEIAIKDSKQSDDGTETKVLIVVSPQWQTYYIPLSWFINVDLSQVYFLSEIILNGNSPQRVQVSEIAYTSQPPAAGRILPDFISGGGWSTAMYFTNLSGAIVNFPVSFFKDDGNPLYIPTPSNGSLTVGLTVQLGPRATSVLAFSNAGALPITGYVSAMLPDDVAAHAEIRLSVTGQPDQKADVRFSGTSAKSSTVIFDETKSVTSLFIVNPGNSDANLSLSAWNGTGNSLGQASLRLAARTKQTYVLRNLPGMMTVMGQQGSLFIDVSSSLVQSSGNVAVLVLSSEGTVLTAIPTADK